MQKKKKKTKGHESVDRDTRPCEGRRHAHASP